MGVSEFKTKKHGAQNAGFHEVDERTGRAIKLTFRLRLR